VSMVMFYRKCFSYKEEQVEEVLQIDGVSEIFRGFSSSPTILRLVGLYYSSFAFIDFCPYVSNTA